VRLLAEDYVKSRNAHIDVEPAKEYHGKLLAFAAGKRG
jgi:hypothetical protein